jgi:hypothetical protein
MSGQGPVRAWLSYLWALVPPLSLGFATPLVFFFAASRLRSGRLWIACAAYSAILVIWVWLSARNDIVAAIAPAILTVGALVHAMFIRRAVFFGPSKPSAMKLAVDRAGERRRLREQARRLAVEDPALALELGIGRPDLRRDYDDGGVIDVNHVPPRVLLRLPGVTPERAEVIVRMREERGGFVSAEELCASAELPAEVSHEITEHTVYLPGLPPAAHSY